MSRIVRSRNVKDGKHVTVELKAGERLMVVSDNKFYRLGEPLQDEVLSGHVLDIQEVTWCNVQQKWST